MKDYREMTPAQINEELTYLPDRISEQEYAWEENKIILEEMEATLLDTTPDDRKNAESRKAWVNSNEQYIEQSKIVAKKKVTYHKTINRKECIIEIARNLRATEKAYDTSNIRED